MRRPKDKRREPAKAGTPYKGDRSQCEPRLGCVLVALARLERMWELWQQRSKNPYNYRLREACLADARRLLRASLNH